MTQALYFFLGLFVGFSATLMLVFFMVGSSKNTED